MELDIDNNREKYLATILNNINEGIHVVNENGETVIYNNKMAELEDMDKESVIGKPLLDVFPSLDEENSTLLKTLHTGKKVENKQQEYLNKYGEKIITINSTIPIKFEKNKIWALEVAKDITEIKNLYNKINKLQDKLYNNKDLEDDGDSLYNFSDIKGKDPKLKKVIKYAKQAAKTDSSILIVGDTGTGKELFAQSIHNSSRRSEKPFIAQNCAALPENLLEGILFGTRKGGFTGAVNRNGLFEQANGGTLLLDEINSMSPTLQAKLLRVLQTNKVRPVGGDEEIKVDVRIIATTNTPPIKAIRSGDLREDLYYRLAVVLLYLPLLSERKKDIELLSNYFIEKFSRKFSLEVEGLSEEVLKLFKKYDWPGNVRQLEHVIEGAINILGDEKYIKREHVESFLIDIEEEDRDSSEEKLEKDDKLPDMIDKYEKEIITTTLNESNWNITKAAEKLGIKRQSLQYRIDKYDLK
ncbi:MAG: sigma-54 interaction domain-containing protein [Bacillota bacterium]